EVTGHAPEIAISVPESIGHEADYANVRRIRGSICVLGPLLARAGRARVALPGGDAIGSRALDLHIMGLERLGASFDNAHGYLIAEAPKLSGAQIWLDFPSVGATEHIMMAAVVAEGATVIDNAAREPEIVDLCEVFVTENIFEGRFMFIDELLRLGADVRTDGHHAIVRGRERLSGAPVRATDIRAGAALVLAGLVADGVTTVGDVQHVDRGYQQFVESMRSLGARLERREDDTLV